MSALDPSLFELFREEVRTHTNTLSAGLIELESDPTNPTRIESLMRAAHSIKGACRIANLDTGVRLAHVMEDVLVAAQSGLIRLTPVDVDQLLKGTDVLTTLSELRPESAADWEANHSAAVGQLEPILAGMVRGERPPTVEGGTADINNNGGAQNPVDPSPDPGDIQPAPHINDSRGANTLPPVPPFTPSTIAPNPLPLGEHHSMLDLFREELRSGLLVSSDPATAQEGLKKIRGAAILVKCTPVARVATAMGAFLNAAQEGQIPLPPEAAEWMRYAVATLAGGIGTDDDTFHSWASDASSELIRIAEVFEVAIQTSSLSVKTEAGSGGGIGTQRPAVARSPQKAVADASEVRVQSPPPTQVRIPEREKSATPPSSTADEAVVRVSAHSLNRLMGLAGESLVQARWLPSFSAELLALRKEHDRLSHALDAAFQGIAVGLAQEQVSVMISDARTQAHACRSQLIDRAAAFDNHTARNEDLNARLYREVIISRMRPFGDGLRGLPRLVRDMARGMGKDARMVLDGEATEVDRDILEKLESPLSHLVRNAVDHGLETPAERTASGKPPTGTIRVEARHRAGMLQVVIADDGGGVNLDRLRQKVVEKKLSPADVAARLTEAELLEFLFLPGFSTAGGVTEYSGRGVGLDVVQDTVRKVGGSVRISTVPGRGTTFHLQLPLTLSVIRAVVVDISGEPYAFPHTRIDRLTRVSRSAVRSVEHRQFVTVDDQNVGLVVAAQVLDLPISSPPADELAVVLMSDSSGTYGLVVDHFCGEQDLVVRPLDPRLGKVPNLSAAALLDDGSPVLIVDAEDLIRSMDQYIQTGSLTRCDTRPAGPTRTKRVLVVDDSITVREVERQLLTHKGYDVTIAVDGMDGWNKVRGEPFDLLVSDIDMPRMTGLQLVAAVRGEPRLSQLPVVIVSYKERDEDRLRGLEAGANCYLTKSAFHDNRFIEAVEDLIGPPR